MKHLDELVIRNKFGMLTVDFLFKTNGTGMWIATWWTHYNEGFVVDSDAI